MPSTDEHLDQARHNESLLAQLDRDAYGDWAMTVAFYTGLHWIDALLVSRNVHPPNHEVRDSHVRKRIELRPIATQYFLLKSRSVNARYDCVPFTRIQVNSAETPELRAIKDELKRYFP